MQLLQNSNDIPTRLSSSVVAEEPSQAERFAAKVALVLQQASRAEIRALIGDLAWAEAWAPVGAGPVTGSKTVLLA